MEQPNQDYYGALGSGQRVKVKKKFQRKAKKAYNLCLKAIESGDTDAAFDKWKKVFGRPFPSSSITLAEGKLATYSSQTWDNTEQFIEDLFPIDIRYDLRIDCDVLQNGFRENLLSEFLRNKFRLQPNKTLKFRIVESNVEGENHIYWKVLNRGDEAKRKNCIRGHITLDSGNMKKVEHTSFRGEHRVECYAVKNGVVVAKDRIDVPIE
jgi:hypothetical protein